MNRLQTWLVVATIALALPAFSLPAHAATPLPVGNDAPTTLTYCPLDYGLEHGLFARHGLDVQPATFFGTAKGQPALIAGAVDILLGAGSEMAFIAKGAPERAVAVAAGPPGDMAIIVRPDATIRSLADLKGHKLGYTNIGGLTDWLSRQIISREHFAPNDLTRIAAGTNPTQAAMLVTGALDAAIMDDGSAITLELQGKARVLQTFATYVPDFAESIIYARQDLIDQHPDTLRAFLAAWFEAQDAMLNDPAFVAHCIVKKTNVGPDIAARVFNETRTIFSPDGKFLAPAMQTLAQSFVDTGVLPEQPDMTKLYTEAFLPPR